MVNSNLKNETEDWVLPNGYTFLAITRGMMGSFAKATDPITAAREAHKYEGGPKNPVLVVYGLDEDLSAGDFGGYQWNMDRPPTPIGFFTVTERSVRPARKNEFNDDHPDCEGWLIEANAYHAKRVKEHSKRKLENA